MQDRRADSRRQRRKRGVLIDSWVKTNLLPDEYDSDNDSAGRVGGIDDVSRSHSPARKDFHDPGDAGEAAKQISDSLRHIGKALDGVHLPKQRKRLRGDASLGEPTTVSKAPHDPPSTVRAEPFSSTFRGGPSMGPQDDTEVVTKVKRGGKPRAKAKPGEGKTSGGASPSSAAAPKKRRKPAVKKTGEAAESEGSKIGERGIPVELFLKDAGDEPRSEASGPPDDAGEMSGVEEAHAVGDAPVPRSSLG